MPANFLICPTTSPLQLVKVGVAASTIYHSIQFNQDWFRLSIREWQEKRFPNGKAIDYAQKWQLEDPVRPQIAVPAGRKVRAYLINCSNNTIYNNIPSTSSVYPGDIKNGILCERFQYDFSANGLGVVAGRYWFVVEVSNEPLGSEETYEYYVSEPQQFRANWPYTLRLEWSNTRNDYNTRFDMIRRFVLRVDGNIGEPTFSHEDSGFTDQQQNEEILYSGKTYEYEFTFGAKWNRQDRLPRWLLNIVDEGMRCNYFTADGKRFVRPANTNIDISPSSANYPLSKGVITLHGYDEENNQARGAGSLTYQFPLTYPIGIHLLFLADGSQPYYIAQDVIVEDQAQLLSIIATANSGDIDGAFTLDTATNLLTYQLGPNERFESFVDNIYTRFVEMDIARTSGNNNFRFTLASGVCLIDWGEISVQYVGLGNPAITQTYIHTYITTTPKVVRLFHRDNITKWYINYSFDGFKLTDLAAEIPRGLIQLQVNNQNYAAIDGSFFSDIYGFKPILLQSLILTENATTSVSNIDFRGMQQVLGYLDFSNNSLPVSAVNMLLYNFYDSGDYPYGGQYYIKQLTPGAPTGLGLVAKDGLISYGWNPVDTD